MRKVIELAVVVLFSSLLYAAATHSQSSGIGYSSYEAALADLKTNPNASISMQGGWIMVSMNENSEMSLWSFTPEEHSAHPAVVKRSITEVEGSFDRSMEMLCNGAQVECDKLLEKFERLNKPVRESVGYHY